MLKTTLSFLVVCPLLLTAGCGDDDNKNTPMSNSSMSSMNSSINSMSSMNSSMSSMNSSMNSMSSMMNSSSSSANMGVYTHVRGGDLMKTMIGAELYPSLVGIANLTVTEAGSAVEVHVTGLTPNTMYASHVHNGLCSDGGGAHYLQDATGEDIAPNGLWPTLMTDAAGMATGMAMQTFVVRDDAKSVVIHQHGTGARLACADLMSSGGMAGNFTATTLGAQMYPKVMGHAYVSVRSNDTSKAEITVMGLAASQAYPAHIHVGKCETGGGAHYLQDLAGMDVALNGLWPMVNTTIAGDGFGSATNPFKVRLADTKSAVIHQTGTGDRMACADLNMPLLAFRSGEFMATAAGKALYGDAAIKGHALLTITPDGTSSVKLTVSGLKSDVQYPSHVHVGSCESGGGAHYLHTMTGQDVADNGLWPVFVTNTASVGMGSANNSFVVRNDARSVVIHEPVSNTRIACADLK